MRKFLKTRKVLFGFTLAEVLVALTIIGIVASITVPSIIQSTQNVHLQILWKKKYSEFNQVTIRILNDNGGTLIGSFTDGTDGFRDLYLNYMPYLSKDGWYGAADQPHNLNGPDSGAWGCTSATLQDGTLLWFGCNNPDYASSTCQATFFGNLSKPMCGVIYVDINGRKGPNIIGRDVFTIFVHKDSIEPSGGPYTGANPNDCDTGHDGYGCSAKYLMQ